MARVVWLISVATLLSGCVSQGWRQSDLVERRANLQVELEEYTEEGIPRDVHAHPATIEPARLRSAFSSLQHQISGIFGTSDPEWVVEPTQVDDLAEAVAAGLARAKPSERVRFLVRKGSTTLFVLPSTTHTRGVAFVSPAGVLNLAFDEVNAIPDIDETGSIDEYWGNPTRYTRTGGKFLLPEYAENGETEDGEVMRLWASMPIDEIPVAPTVAATTTEQADSAAEAGSSEAAVSEERGSSPESASAPADPTPKGALTDAEVLAQLRLLEQLYDDKAIDEATYRAKRAELLKPRR